MKIAQMAKSTRYFEFFGGLNLKRAVAGLKIAHLTKITLSLEFLIAHPDGARVVPPKSSKRFVLLRTCAFFILVNRRF